MAKTTGFDIKRQYGFTTIAMICFVSLYLPVILLVVYSFNAGSSVAIWEGFSLQWYRSAWANDQVQEATIRSLIIASPFWPHWPRRGYAVSGGIPQCSPRSISR